LDKIDGCLGLVQVNINLFFLLHRFQKEEISLFQT
jgi:hypothetical protein